MHARLAPSRGEQRAGRRCRTGALVLAVAGSALLACMAAAHRHVGDRDAYVAANTEVLDGIPQVGGARQVARSDFRYAPGGEAGSSIKHVGWLTNVRFHLPVPERGAVVEQHFRRVLSGWACTFQRRRRNIPFGFTCTRGIAFIWSYISDEGDYELSLDHWHQSLARARAREAHRRPRRHVDRSGHGVVAR